MNKKFQILSAMLIFILTCLLLTSQRFPYNEEDTDWRFYGGNSAGNRYSDLTQINRENVTKLQIAWMYDAADSQSTQKPKWPLEIQCQPIVVNGILYGTGPTLKLFALKAATGAVIWKFNPYENTSPRYTPCRGVMYWEDGDDKRILYTAGSNLYAVDALTGKLISSFGNDGLVDLHLGIGQNLGRDISKLSIDATSPGVIYKDILVLGGRVSEYGDALPGHIRGFNVRTGKLQWVFHTVPQPGEFGYETWSKDSWKRIGGANNWGGMVLDEKRGVVYFGTGSPAVDFYGGARKGRNLFGNCILALNAETGKLKWYFQTVHHDLWDRDIPCPPNLITVIHKGKKTDALEQSTKDGLIFVLNRDTGKPLFPVEERPAITTSALPGEQPWPTQPFPLVPAPFSRQFFTEADITDLNTEAHAYVKKRFKTARQGSKYMPPSKAGTLLFGIGGGAEWPGNAADPEGILYQNANEMVWDLKMADFVPGNTSKDSPGKSLFLNTCAACHRTDRKGSGKEFPSLVDIGKRMPPEDIANVLKTGRGRMPSFQHMSEKDRKLIINFLLNPIAKTETATDEHHKAATYTAKSKSDFPYIPPYINNGYSRFLDPDGYPAVKPPWGTLNAIDLNTGEYLWRVPLGEFPELKAKGIPATGTENYGGPIVTAGGLIFIAGTYDEKIRAFDKKTGKVLWEFQLPAGGFATPITYMCYWKQFVVIAAGGSKNGHKPGGKYIAFALPD